MSGDATHSVRRRIVNLAAQPDIAFSTDVCGRVSQIAQLAATLFRRRDARAQSCARTKTGVAHAERLKNVLLRKLIEWQAAHALHDLAERDETDVAVNETSARRIAQRLFDQVLDRFVIADPAFAQIEIRRVAGAMSQQFFDGDLFPALAFELGYVS